MTILTFVPALLYSSFLTTPAYPTHDFSGQTVIVTGSNTGLGLEAARHIVRLNCKKLIIAVRNVSKGEAAKESILASTQRTDDCLEVWELDLSSNASVQSFAKRAQSLNRIDALIANAGVSFQQFLLAEGHEMTIQTNVFGTFLLALLMLPKLRESAERYGTTPHLEIVSSEVHFLAKFPEREEADVYAKLDSKEDFDPGDRYNVSKLLEVLFVRELVKNTARIPVITLITPGFCHSGLLRDVSGIGATIISFFKAILARTTEVGSRTLVAGAIAGPSSHGEFMMDCENRPVEAWIRTPRGGEIQKKVYDQTMAVLEGIEPGISKNL